MSRRKKTSAKLLDLEGIKIEQLTKVSEVNLSDSDKEFIYFDKMSDGSWRMAYTKSTIPELSKFKGINITEE